MFEEQEFKKIIRLMKICMVISIIAAVFVICTHWRGFHLSITPPAKETRVVVVERSAAAPVRVHHRKPRPIAEPEEDETASSYRPIYRPLPRVHDATARITLAPDAFAQTNIQADNSMTAAPDGYRPLYSVTAHPKKRHRWPVRFFCAIGHGARKVATFGH